MKPKWRRYGLIWGPEGRASKAASHASIPTPLMLDDSTYRIFVSCRDEAARSRPYFFDLDFTEGPKVVGVSSHALMDVGRAGRFDHDGVLCTSVLKLPDDSLIMYYAGFELLRSVRYRLMIGAAISTDRGLSFDRVSEVPILDRIDGQSLFRAGPFVEAIENGFRMIYAGGNSWTHVDGTEKPNYDLWAVESTDALVWPEAGRKILIASGDFHGFGRPWVAAHLTGRPRLMFSARDLGSGRYRMAATDIDGELRTGPISLGVGLEPQGTGFESDTTLFAATLEANGRVWCLYNGNDFGRDGVALAELMDA